VICPMNHSLEKPKGEELHRARMCLSQVVKIFLICGLRLPLWNKKTCIRQLLQQQFFSKMKKAVPVYSHGAIV